MPYTLPVLPYEYAAFSPHIDEETMRLHHDKHHQAYVDKANEPWTAPTSKVSPSLMPCGRWPPYRQTSRRRSATTGAATPITPCSGTR